MQANIFIGILQKDVIFPKPEEVACTTSYCPVNAIIGDNLKWKRYCVCLIRLFSWYGRKSGCKHVCLAIISIAKKVTVEVNHVLNIMHAVKVICGFDIDLNTAIA